MSRPDRQAFARRWADAITGTSYVSMERDELIAHLAGLVDRLVAAVLVRELDPDAGNRIGAGLVATHFTSTDTLGKTLALILEGLPDLLRGAVPEAADVAIEACIAQLTGDIAAGYASALRERSLDEQDEIYRAALRARRQAEQALASNEARFRQVFYSSPVGVAICEPSGEIIQCNRSLEDILDYAPGELVGRDLSELFSPGDRSAMRERYFDLIAGRLPRLRGRFPLRRVDGEPVWANLDTSVLPDAQAEPRYVVTMVDDITDLQLLEQRLQHQTLYDLQTGLPNRQFLLTHLEAVLARFEPSATVTLLHLDLDGFSAINDGLGYGAGDELLDVVARRLEGVIADRPGMVARLGADEYAILLEPSGENSASAPDIGVLAESINTELAEPHYIDDVGIALTATIGIAQLPVGKCRPEELMRAAGVTLRRLRNQGTRQWARYDPDTDRAERVKLQLAAALPGALENGQLQITYQPVVTLADHHLVAVEATLSWDHPQFGRLSHERCARAAERTGASYALGRWLLETAARQATTWRQQRTTVPPIAVNLSLAQAQDPDLVATVTAVLAETGLPAAQLELRAPVAAIRTDGGEFAGSGGGESGAQAEDNLRVLRELGIRTGLDDFAGGIGALRCVAELSPLTVRLAALMVAGHGLGPVLSEAAHTAVRLVRVAGANVIAYPTDSGEQAAYYGSIGANWAVGALFGAPGPPQGIEALLAAQAS
ncbi:MAG: EAL domain-containing protein [Pseudonocardiales bacterium]|nr:EAL domain-containing protein [Pseudonocardiales bacterium]